MVQYNTIYFYMFYILQYILSPLAQRAFAVICIFKAIFIKPIFFHDHNKNCFLIIKTIRFFFFKFLLWFQYSPIFKVLNSKCLYI